MSEHSEHQDIDFIFRQWPYQAGVISARLIRAHDGRELLQMRIEMGMLQMETSGPAERGKTPGQGHVPGMAPGAGRRRQGPALVLSDEQRFGIDREFLQFYQRRICCLALREFPRAVADADHTLAMMDFVAAHWPQSPWTHLPQALSAAGPLPSTQAAAMTALERSTPQAAIEGSTPGWPGSARCSLGWKTPSRSRTTS